MQETNLIERGQPVESVASEIIPVPAPIVTLCSYGNKLTREELGRVATPAGTATHKPIPHITVVEKLIEALSFRQIGVVREEYAVSYNGMKMFGVMDLSSGFDGCRFAIGLRNSHDKSFRLSCTVGLRVFVCENLAFHGDGRLRAAPRANRTSKAAGNPIPCATSNTSRRRVCAPSPP